MTHPPIRVLWVEDSADDIEIFEIAFRRAEVTFKLEIKYDGQEALDYLMPLRNTPGEQPDFILLDLNLPRRDGREVLAAIKNTDKLRSIPVIVLTTSNAEPDIISAYELGAACYLVKPTGLPGAIQLAKSLYQFWSQAEFARRQLDASL